MPNHHPTDEQKMVTALHTCPTDLLEAELEKRKKQEFEEEIPKPVFATLQDFLPVVDLCQSYIGQLAEKEPYADEKLRQYIFEAAMAAVFGKDVWVWVKKRQSM